MNSVADGALTGTRIGDIFYILLRENSPQKLERLARVIRSQVAHLACTDARFAFSCDESFERGRIEVETLLYESWTSGPLVKTEGLSPEIMERLLRRDEWRRADSVEAVLAYASTFDLMMEAASFTGAMRKAALKAFCLLSAQELPSSTDRKTVIELALKASGLERTLDEDGQHFVSILQTVFLLLCDSSLGLSLVADTVANMSEDYFSRYFQKHTGERFSRYVSHQRMKLARSILSFSPSIPLSRLALLCGFQEDGQYFQKVFRETFGETVSQARNRFFYMKVTGFFHFPLQNAGGD